MPEAIIVGLAGRPGDDEARSLARLLTCGTEAVAEVHVDASRTTVGRGLADAARQRGAELIVVASSRRGRVRQIVAGDDVTDVLRHAPCPVAVAPVGYQAGPRLASILVAHDGSLEADAAMRHAIALAARTDARVSVVDVVEPIRATTAWGTADEEALRAEYARARKNLDELSERFGTHGVIATGRAARELAEAGAGADLTCAGLRRGGGLDRLRLGSTVHTLLRHLATPLLLVPLERAEVQDLAPAESPLFAPSPVIPEMG